MKSTGLALSAALLLAAALPAFAEDAPVPKMFRGMQKGQWKVDILEGTTALKSGRAPPSMTICADNLMREHSKSHAQRDESGCKRRLLKDTSDEAAMESVCGERSSTVTMKRESAKSILMEMKSTGGPGGPRNMRMRYTHLGACREGQGTVTYDRNSETCVKIREAVAKMDPAKSCGRAGADREDCEKQARERIAKMKAMCS